ncbi:hypothetical protein Ocin01_00137 [Orchesella cincta]|uniref:Menorin-like domain-containing protein n=1 Tax=Orchesella cincta TaxID=48709 RepID=A0A1D2NMP9_ORCCI|nr:hypothetical protein Ocin01_00137 [Orchesella cincta]
MGIKFYACCCLLWLVYGVVLTSSSKMPEYVSVQQYFSGSGRIESSDVTWAHAVNSHEALNQSINDPKIMMLEADILMGVHTRVHSLEMIPIMAHPPDKSSDLSFAQFLDTVLQATQTQSHHKGIKLDFKEIEAVEPCLVMLKEKLGEDNVTPFPVFINADILMGPVDSTKKPVDAERFISLAKTHAPYATISLGWTTRFGDDDVAQNKGDGKQIVEGKYTKTHMKEMAVVIRKYGGDPPVFSHITFPLRTSLALNSVDEILFLQGKVRSDFSITLWTSKNDPPVDNAEVQNMIPQIGRHRVFLDLPNESDAKALSGEESHHEFDDHHHNPQEGIASRGHSEEENPSDKGSSSAASNLANFFPLVAFGFVSAFIIYRHL